MKKLTFRELEVLKFLVEGYTNEEIAQKMYISTHTSKAHVSSIIKKLCVKNRASVVYAAVTNNLI